MTCENRWGDMHQEVPKPAIGFKRVIKATKYSMEGLGAAIVNESAFRTELVMVAILGPTIFILDASLAYKVMAWSSMGLVMVKELLNSAVEAVVDMVSENYHPFAKRAKDMGSAAVFVYLLICVLSVGVTFWDALS